MAKKKKAAEPKAQKSFRPSPELLTILERLREDMGLNHSQSIEMGVRLLAKQQRIPTTAKNNLGKDNESSTRRPRATGPEPEQKQGFPPSGRPPGTD